MKKRTKQALYVILFIIIAFLIVRAAQAWVAKSSEGFENGQTYALPEELILINLDSRQDRLANFMTHYNSAGLANIIPMHRQSAVVGKDLQLEPLLTPRAWEEMQDFQKTGIRQRHESLTPGAVGCYMSHLEAYERAVKRNKPVIICEDDIQLPAEFWSNVQNALKEVPYDENTIILFNVICGGWDKLKCDLIKPNVYEITQFWSLACYYLTPTAAKSLLAHTRPIDIQLDSEISKMKQRGQLNIYAVPFVNVNGSFGTDIQAVLKQ